MRVRFKISLTVSILIVVGVLVLFFYLHINSVSNKAAEEIAGKLFNSASEKIEQRALTLINQSFQTVYLVAGLDDINIDAENVLTSSTLRTIFRLLEKNRELYSIYFGYEDSRFVQVICADKDPSILKPHMAPDETMWILRMIDVLGGGERIQEWVFLNNDLTVLSTRLDKNPEYDPRLRPWYIKAKQENRAVLSNVYRYNSLKQLGITASEKKQYSEGIAGVDLTLRKLESMISSIKISEHSQVLLLNDQFQVIDKSGVPRKNQNSFHTFLSGLEEGKTFELRKVQFENVDYYVKVSDVFKHGSSLKILVLAPLSDFNTYFINIKNRLTYTTLIWIVFFIPIIYLLSKHMTNRLSIIASEADKIRDLIFEREERSPSPILEFYLLEKNFDAMRYSLLEKTQALKISQSKLNRLVELGISFSAERDAEKLMEKILLGAKELTNADGGTLYQLDGNALKFKITQNTSLNIAYGGSQKGDIPCKPIPLYLEGEENHQSVVAHSIWEKRSILIKDIYDDPEFDFASTKIFDQDNNYRSRSFLIIPLIPRGADPIGALQLINCRDNNGNVTEFSEELLRAVEALGAQAATIFHNLKLLEEQETLMDSMIQFIAGAIDAKSPYTGGHCKRVPELAIMMAEEASHCAEGAFADFAFTTEDEWREFSIGAWLHDCGKVITPEYVVDKATKLETIFNRIHEIRTRFEVLLRDAEVDYYKGLLAGGDKDELKVKLDVRKADLIEKFAFVAECNMGSEFLSDEKVDRLKSIGNEEWIRNFDIRLGLAHEEELLFQDCDMPPVVEKLLADKAYHILKRKKEEVKQQYSDLDFKTPMPEHLYNRGEFYNLSVRRGTLTEEERFKVSEHIMQTIAMLEKMPFPAKLARVPEYAGTHHETMTGSGYPRKLDASQLSIPSRIMAVADIFEALTASDRPYKKAKTLSEAIKILHSFKNSQHIDPDVFDLFLTSGIYRKYAAQFLLPEQIDDVDISQYLG